MITAYSSISKKRYDESGELSYELISQPYWLKAVVQIFLTGTKMMIFLFLMNKGTKTVDFLKDFRYLLDSEDLTFQYYLKRQKAKKHEDLK